MKGNFDEIMKKIQLLLSGYSNEYRASIQPYKFTYFTENNPKYVYHPDDIIVRESLLEHVGTLPILATFFHPLVKGKVNLGRVLEMLAIHDIGEIITGDKITFIKGADDNVQEEKVALELLPKQQHPIYMEYLEQKTPESHFAKSVDKISPDIYDLISDRDATIYRLKYLANIDPENLATTIEKAKSPYMQWDPFFKEFHAELVKQLRTKYNN